MLAVFKEIGFGTNFVAWVEALLSNPESCVINAGIAIQYFPLQRGGHQEDPISVYVVYFMFRNFASSNRK